MTKSVFFNQYECAFLSALLYEDAAFHVNSTVTTNLCISQTIPAAPSTPPPPPSQAITRHFPALQPRGWGISKFCAARGSEFPNHEATTEISGTHVVSNPNITTQRILLGKQADWLICQGGQRIKEDCKGMFSFLCMSSFIAYQARIT